MPAPKKSNANAKPESLDSIFDRLHKILSDYAPPLKSNTGKVRGKRDFHLTVPKAVVVPGAYGGKPVEVSLASIILQKGYVGFYFMPIYITPMLKNKLSPALKQTLQGKNCFHIKQLDTALDRDIAAALEEGVKSYKDRGWL